VSRKMQKGKEGGRSLQAQKKGRLVYRSKEGNKERGGGFPLKGLRELSKKKTVLRREKNKKDMVRL